MVSIAALGFGNQFGACSASLHKSLPVKNGELIHRRFPIVGRPAPIGCDVARSLTRFGQPDQLGGRFIAGEVTSGFDDFAQL